MIVSRPIHKEINGIDDDPRIVCESCGGRSKLFGAALAVYRCATASKVI